MTDKSRHKYDQVEGYCRKLGHHLKFDYCQTEAGMGPCSKIVDCWFEKFDVLTFIEENYTKEQAAALQASAPKPKMMSILDIIEKVKKRSDS